MTTRKQFREGKYGTLDITQLHSHTTNNIHNTVQKQQYNTLPSNNLLKDTTNINKVVYETPSMIRKYKAAVRQSNVPKNDNVNDGNLLLELDDGTSVNLDNI